MLLRTGLALLAGAALAQAYEPIGLAVLLPLGVAGFVLVLHGLPARRAWLPGLAFGIGFQFVLLFWMRVVGYDAWLALAALQAAFFGPLGAAVPWLQRLRLGPVWVATAWVAVESIRSTWPLSGMPWGRLAFATAGTPWQEALPYVGMTLVSFLLALLGALLARLVTDRDTRGRSLLALAAVGAVSLLPALVPYEPTVVDHRRVAVVQGDVPGDGTNVLLDHRAVTRNHVEATEAFAQRIEDGEEPRPDFVIWPENSTAVDPFADAEVGSGIERASAALEVPLLVGAMVDAGTEHVLNQSIVWASETGAGDRYSKRHPVPFGEYIPWRGLFDTNIGRLALIPRDMMSGTRVTPLTVDGARVSAAICFDVAYDDGIHDQVNEGGQLVTVQTSNALFVHTNQIEQQFEISRLRALETGRYVAVAAINGVSGIIAPDGTVLERAGIRTQSVLTAEVGLVDDITPGVRLRQWPGRVAVGVTLVALAWSALTYRRRRMKEATT
ncbi:apolipoprotein N-acyltransferase [Nocardioides sp.]|uniref:apolipoprotein N-acyltransferase n=1 Tax=Nocardioides sp. TaxID=35761 RepID=UPI002ED12AC6